MANINNTQQDSSAFVYNRFAGLSPWQKAALILSEGAMAFGEGLGAGKPYSNYLDMQAQQAKMAYEQWQQRQQQDEENKIKLLQMGYVSNDTQTPQQEGISPSISIGGKLYKFNPELLATKPVYTINPQGGLEQIGAIPKTGQVISPTTLQTPQEKQNQEVTTAVKKDAMTRLNKLKELIPVIDHFDNVMSSIETGIGLSGRFKGIGKGALAWTQIDPFVSTAFSEIKGLRPQIVRGLGDVGNLSETEQKAGEQLVPNPDDSTDTKLLKALGFYIFTKNKINNVVRNAGLEQESSFQDSLNYLNNQIKQKYNQLLQLGIDEKRIKQFLGEHKLELDTGKKNFSNLWSKK